jgi:sugar porter (SP) family MFS transporter
LVRELAADVSDELIRTSWYGQSGWRWMFALTAVPAVFFFVGMLTVPESPRWLAKNGRPEQARRVLDRLGDERYASVALAEIESTLAGETERVNFRALLQPGLRRVLILGIALAVFQQWCGINVIFNYAENILKAAGYGVSATLKSIVWIGLVNFVFTLVALSVVDRGGRRPLMLIGSSGLAIIYSALGIFFGAAMTGLPILLLVLAAIACYAMSLAPVTWVVISEIFPNRIRGAAMAVAVAALWLACFVLTYTFPLINAQLGAAGTFWLYSAVCALGFFFILMKLPETKGRTLEEIEADLTSK